MTYEQFSQLWDALVVSKPKDGKTVPISNGMSPNTATALIEYADGNKDKFLKIRAFLKKNPAPAF